MSHSFVKQRQEAQFPIALTPDGLKFTNRMVQGTQSEPPVSGARRYIFSPPSEKNGQVVGEFYKHFITAASHDPNVGLLEFRNSNNELGGLVADVLKNDTDNIKIQKIPGTAMWVLI